MAPIPDEFEVDQLLDARIRGNNREFLVKWKGFDHTADTWEPEKNLLNCESELAKFKDMVVTRSGSRTRVISSTDVGTSKPKSPARAKSVTRSKIPAPKKPAESPSPKKQRKRSVSRGRLPTRARSRSRSRGRYVTEVNSPPRSTSDSSAVKKSEVMSQVLNQAEQERKIRSRVKAAAAIRSGSGDAALPKPDQVDSVQTARSMTQVRVSKSATDTSPRHYPAGSGTVSSLTIWDMFWILLFSAIIVCAVLYQYGYLNQYSGIVENMQSKARNYANELIDWMRADEELTTQAPTTQAPTTQAPTTQAPTTAAPKPNVNPPKI